MAAPPKTRAAYLALRAEAEALAEGHRFLDELRLALGAAAMAELQGHEAAEGPFEAAWEEAVARLRAAVARHGLEALLLHPGAPPPGAVATALRPHLGVALAEAAWEAAAPEGPGAAPDPDPSPELEACRAAWRALLSHLAPLAAREANLVRLAAAYRRASRRARALEEVLLPEARSAVRRLGEALEEEGREEAVRLREAAARLQGGAHPAEE